MTRIAPSPTAFSAAPEGDLDADVIVVGGPRRRGGAGRAARRGRARGPAARTRHAPLTRDLDAHHRPVPRLRFLDGLGVLQECSIWAHRRCGTGTSRSRACTTAGRC